MKRDIIIRGNKLDGVDESSSTIEDTNTHLIRRKNPNSLKEDHRSQTFRSEAMGNFTDSYWAETTLLFRGQEEGTTKVRSNCTGKRTRAKESGKK